MTQNIAEAPEKVNGVPKTDSRQVTVRYGDIAQIMQSLGELGRTVVSVDFSLKLRRIYKFLRAEQENYEDELRAIAEREALYHPDGKPVVKTDPNGSQIMVLKNPKQHADAVRKASRVKLKIPGEFTISEEEFRKEVGDSVEGIISMGLGEILQ